MTPAPESPDAAREPVPSIAVDRDILDCWRVNYGLHREPHALHDFWRNGAPAGAVLALRAAVLEIERLHASQAEAQITRLTAERDAALRDAERYRWLREAPDVAGDDLLSQLVRDYADKYLDAAIDSEMARAARSAQERGNV